MKKIMLLGAVTALSACVYRSPVNYERFYSNADITKVDWSKVDGKGSSCQTNWFFGLLPAGNNSLSSAVERGEIAKISYVDTDTVLYLPLLMTRDCTNVYGELTPAARAAMAYYDNDDEFDAKPAKAEAKSDYEFPSNG
jgi:hypothetical protein